MTSGAQAQATKKLNTKTYKALKRAEAEFARRQAEIESDETKTEDVEYEVRGGLRPRVEPRARGVGRWGWLCFRWCSGCGRGRG